MYTSSKSLAKERRKTVEKARLDRANQKLDTTRDIQLEIDNLKSAIKNCEYDLKSTNVCREIVINKITSFKEQIANKEMEIKNE